MTRTTKQRLFIERYLVHFNATRAAIEAGYSEKTAYSIGQELLKKPEIQAAIKAKVAEFAMPAAEVLKKLTDHARGDLGVFFKIVEEWTFYPLPSYEIIDAKEVEEPQADGTTNKRTSYWVKHVALDMEKVIDPQYSHLIKKFTDSPKNGLGIELHPVQNALEQLGKYHNLFAEKEKEPEAVETAPLYIPAVLIGSEYLEVNRDISDGLNSEYDLYGGRGSLKSTYTAQKIIELLVNNPMWHALATRQVANTLRNSVYSQFERAIDDLGLAGKFKCTTNPLEIKYIPTGQTIYFRGADDPTNIKSIKPPFGYIALLWFEEFDQFHGEEQVRSIVQSALRGGDIAYQFRTWNTPRSKNHWVNKYLLTPKANRYHHHSTYLSVPKKWLGKVFIDEAEFLKEARPDAYEHEYLGISNGTGGMIFENVTLREITDEEIAQFDRVIWGGDWGYYPDPADFGPVYFDAARRKLYIFGEYRAWKKNNETLFKELVREHGLTAEDLLILDSAEPKSVADFQTYSRDGVEMVDENGAPVLDAKGKPIMLYGPSCRGAEKGPESVKYSIKWLQGVAEIVIDPVRCPFAAEEFINYEHERDKDGNILSDYPDKNNHSIDRVRYATNLIWRVRGK